MTTQETEPRYYQFFAVPEHDARLTAYEWWPTSSEFVYYDREQPGDTWGPPAVVTGVTSLETARRVASRGGHTYEEAVR